MSLIAPGLTRRCLSPFSSTSVAVSHATLYAGTSTHVPNVLWTTPTRVVVEGQDIEFKEFQGAYLDLLERVERVLHNAVLLGVPLKKFGFEIDRNTPLIDEHARTDPGYSMFSDPRNPFVKLRFAMAKRFFKTSAASFLHKGLAGGKVSWDDLGVERWLEDHAECTRLLSLLMQLSGGQPCRGVEFCLMKVANMAHRMRNFHWVNPGMLVYVMYYNKTTSNTSMDRVVAHAVPWRVARIFLVLHGLVNPFASMLVKHLYGKPARFVQETSAFALFGKEMVSEQLSAECANFFKNSLGVDVRLRIFRQFMIACQRQLMPDAFAPIHLASNVVDAQAGHSTETALQHYAILAGEHHLFSHNTILKYIAASSRWWVVLCLDGILEESEAEAGRRASQTIAKLTAGDHDAPSLIRSGPSLTKEDVADAVNKALTEGPLVGNIIGQVLHMINNMNLAVEPVPAPKSSQSAGSSLDDPRHPPSTPVRDPPFTFGSGQRSAFHFSAGPPAVCAMQPSHTSTAAPFVPVEPRHLVVLRTYTGDEYANWTSRAQGQAFVHAHARQRSLLVVLRTGGGKSVVFGALTLLESGVTVVVFPMRALLQDQVRSLESKGVSVSVWPVDDSVPDGVVAVSVEEAKADAFTSWLSRLNSKRRLNRLVVDEVHVLEISQDYRRVMTQLHVLLLAGVPLVALSASVPPSMEPQLRELLGRPTWSVVREGTQRTNLVLRIADYDTVQDAQAALAMHTERFRSELRPGEGILILCRSYVDVREVGEILGCLQYRKDMPEAERDRNAAEWLSGAVQVIAATSGLGTGVHHPACRVVIHYKSPFTIVDYAQEIGRSGRDGLLALCIVIVVRPLPSPPVVDRGGWDKLVEMLDGKNCMRLYMSQYLDGDDLATTCSDGKYERCTRCVQAMRRAVQRQGIGLSIPDAVGKLSTRFKAGDWIEEHLPTSVVHAPAPRSRFPSSGLASSSVDLSVSSSPAAFEPAVARPVQRFTSPTPNTSQPPAPHAHVEDGHAPPEHSSAAPEASGSRGPSFSARQRDIVLRASANALPPPAVGPLVVADSEASRSHRRQFDLQTALREAKDRPYDFGTLMEVKAKMANRCIYCVLFQTTSANHVLLRCKFAPDNGSWSVDSFQRNGMSYKQAKSTLCLPADGTLCYRCWWPKNLNHYVDKLGCIGRDQIVQLCWMVFCDPGLRRSLCKVFGQELEGMNGAAYIQWLSGVVRTLQWNSKSQTMVKAHMVFLWVLYEAKKIFSFTPDSM